VTDSPGGEKSLRGRRQSIGLNPVLAGPQGKLQSKAPLCLERGFHLSNVRDFSLKQCGCSSDFPNRMT